MPDPDKIRVEIIDTGGGIPFEIIDKIFEPFFTTKPVGDGTGQGLAIARAIVVGKHGGALDVSSIPNVGSTFGITIPL
jgi:signal transduction histidine kinase